MGNKPEKIRLYIGDYHESRGVNDTSNFRIVVSFCSVRNRDHRPNRRPRSKVVAKRKCLAIA